MSNKKLPFYSYVGALITYVPFFKIMKMNNKTYLDESFMSKGRWEDLEKEAWMCNVVRGLAVTPLVVAKISACLENAPEGSEAHSYFLDLKKQRKEFVTCDGWNRNCTALAWAKNKVTLAAGVYEMSDKGYTITIPKASTYKELSDEAKVEIDGILLPVCYVTKANRRDLALLFSAVNSSVAQNAQELRQALETNIAPLIRKLAEILDKYFQTHGLFTPMQINRRQTDEFVLDCCMFTHSLFAKNWTSDTRDFHYNTEESALTATFNYTSEIIKKVIKSDGTFHDKRSAFLNFMLRVLLDKEDQKPKSAKEFDNFIQEKHIEFLNAKDPKTGDPKYTLIELEDDEKTVKKVFTYRSASRRTPKQVNWAVGLFMAEIAKRPDLTVSLDPVRIFSMAQRFQMWVLQGGVVGEKDAICPVTNKKIPLTDIYIGYIWHADHIIPYDKGGKTIVSEDSIINNGQLICAVANRKKSNKLMTEVECEIEN